MLAEHSRRYGAMSLSSEMVLPPSTSEDLHAWSIYRQNLNSDFTDSALGSSDKSPAPYGNFQLREATVHSILANPKYGCPRSELGTNMYTYLKFGLPRVLPPNYRGGGGGGGGRQRHSSGYDSTDDGGGGGGGGGGVNGEDLAVNGGLRSARSEDLLARALPSAHPRGGRHNRQTRDDDEEYNERRQKSVSEANLLTESRLRRQQHHHQTQQQQLYHHHHRSNGHLTAASPRSLRNGAFVNRALEDDDGDDDDDDVDLEDEEGEEEEEVVERERARSASRLAKASSHLSLGSRRSRRGGGSANAAANGLGGVSYRHEAPMLNDKYFPRDTVLHMNAASNFSPSEGYEGFKYPHLQLRNVSYDSRKTRERLLDSVSMEARGGELVAIMATTQVEGTALCDILTDSYNSWQMRLTGDILVNGVSVTTSRLRDRVAYVRQDNSFSPDMSVRQTMLFYAFLREPGTTTRRRDTKGRINALIEDLGLAQVKHTRVKDLTVSERQRLNVACQLLLDTDILVLDQPTRGMDIFDTFFLVEYLRQWAGRGRIVLLTLQPPTYEILTMISKVALISTGRLMYFGKRREMLPYFAFIEYPCPAYKNPSDYYLDLVTLDDLSNEAMLESSQRIDQLAAAFKRRAEPLSDPGPPGILPPKIKRANLIVQILGLLIRAMIYTFPFNVIQWVLLVLLSGLMSIAVGLVFAGIRWRYWDTAWQKEPREQPIFEQDNINDRLGFHYSFLCVAIWPILLALMTDEWRNKGAVTRDVTDRLYSKAAYCFTMILYSIPSSCVIFLAYIIPGYLVAGLHYPEVKEPLSNLFSSAFYLYMVFMLLYLFAVRCLCTSMAHFFHSRHVAAGLSGLLGFLLALPAGPALLHPDAMGQYITWLRFVSPAAYTAILTSEGEFTPVNNFRCTANPVITDNSIIKQVPCGLPNGKEVLRYFHLLSPFSDESSINSLDESSDQSPWLDLRRWGGPILAITAFLVFFLVLGVIFFIGRKQKTKMSRSRKNKL